MHVRRFAAILLLFLACATTSLAESGSEKLPFCAGERLTYSLRWASVSAGTASIEVLADTDVDGVAARHFRMQAKTTSFVDIFYKVRDHVDSYTDADLTRSLLYLKKQREGSYKRDITVRFFWDKFQAQYSNVINGPKKPIQVYPGTFDPLSVFYAFRTMPLEVGESILRPVTDGVKCVIGKATITARETVEVPAGTFDCFVVEPDLAHVGGVFKKSKDAVLRIWVSADERRLPVRISSKVVVGSFHALLTEISSPFGCYGEGAVSETSPAP